jgi:hypothetical protein
VIEKNRCVTLFASISIICGSPFLGNPPVFFAVRRSRETLAPDLERINPPRHSNLNFILARGMEMIPIAHLSRTFLK